MLEVVNYSGDSFRARGCRGRGNFGEMGDDGSAQLLRGGCGWLVGFSCWETSSLLFADFQES